MRSTDLSSCISHLLSMDRLDHHTIGYQLDIIKISIIICISTVLHYYTIEKSCSSLSASTVPGCQAPTKGEARAP